MNKSLPLSIALLTIAVGSGFIYFANTGTVPNGDLAVSENANASAGVSAGTMQPAVPDNTLSIELNNDESTDNDDGSVIDVTEIGLSPLSDDDYHDLQFRLHNDSALLSGIVEEYRSNTNPRRASQLASLLGEHNVPSVLDVASELVYSGDPTSQTLGLDLLSYLQPQNSVAREIAIDLLTSDLQPALLVSAMNVLATPSDNATYAQKERILTNTSLLADHPSVKVRSHSIELLGRWDQKAGIDVLSNAISDPHPQVRARAVSALHGLSHPGEFLISKLLSVAENTAEQKTIRQSALYTLQDMPLSAENQLRYQRAQTSVRTRSAGIR